MLKDTTIFSFAKTQPTDIIHGVTVVEQGVSRVVPVDLRELEV